ncbi:MAG: flavin reductase family protein [candidate division Zixibacteria bacterium HGW-Zixibacteria-1]|nr:MAG: flavin reductase family protein [candidate division Zixibacteria bacterium HGW-Zixibacteria-1]
MDKVQLKPQSMLIPLPATMVSCAAEGFKPNIITISWIGIVNSEPPMLSISVTPKRHSHQMIKMAGDFVVNLTSERNLKEADFCGNRSGREYDKFEALKLTPIPGKVVGSPMIKECPINLECQVRESMVLGSHEMFVAEIVAVHVDLDLIDDKGKINIDKLKPLVYCTVAREYRGGLTKLLSRYGEAAGKKEK